MAKVRKLGELLVEAGLVSWLQIDQALQAQQIFGGRLGTNLIEMGVLDDDTLASFLSSQYNVPRISVEELEVIDKATLYLIPAKAAQRLRILPVVKKKDFLVVAMIDPSDARILSRVEENVGSKIVPHVATEIELLYYLEKYYGIPRDMRHIQLMNQMLEKRKNKTPRTDMAEIISSQLDRYISTDEAINHFFKNIQSLDLVPVRLPVADITKVDLTPELMFLLQQVDGFSNLGDIFSISPLRRVSTLRSLVYFVNQKLIRFENP